MDHALFAMFVYWLVGWAITALFAVGINTSNDETVDES